MHSENVCVCVCVGVGGARWLTCGFIYHHAFPLNLPLIWTKSTLSVPDISFLEINAAALSSLVLLCEHHREFWEFSKQSRMFSCLFLSGSHGCGPSGWCERSLNTTRSTKLWWPLSAKVLQHLDDVAHHRWQRPDRLFLPSFLLGHMLKYILTGSDNDNIRILPYCNAPTVRVRYCYFTVNGRVQQLTVNVKKAASRRSKFIHSEAGWK